MMRYIAVLRGINVGGHRRILMSDLKELFMDLDFENISTYIQSGNVLFSSSSRASIQTHADRISRSIKSKYDYDVPVIVIPALDFDRIVKNNPFASADVSQLHVTFLSRIPDPTLVQNLESDKFLPDEYHIDADKVYLMISDKYHKTKLSNKFFEKKLDVDTTTRNWKTVLKLRELSAY